MPAKNGRWKPCLACQKPFWCTKAFDGGNPRYREKKHCSKPCFFTSIRYTEEEAAAAFWSRVDKSAGPDACWPWTAAIAKVYGYGRVGFRQRTWDAHKVAWILTNGEVPKGMHVLHKCDNRPCCNPVHFFLGTNADNISDKTAKGRQDKGEDIFSAKLTEIQVREILANPPRLQRGKRGGTEFQAYAARYGITESALSHLLAGRTWKHIPRSYSKEKV